MEPAEAVSYTYGKATLTWFEEIFEEYNLSRIAIAPFLSPETE